MAQSDENVLIRGFHGKVGNQVVLRQWNGKTILSNVPKKHKQGPEGKQLASCNRFKMGMKWAAKALKDPLLYAAYKARITGLQNVVNAALADYMKPPVVTGVNSSLYHGRAGDTILVTATDNFHVKEVSLVICTPDGEVLETGPCHADQSGTYWQYTAVNPVENISGIMITAIAKDTPGHTGEMTVTVL